MTFALTAYGQWLVTRHGLAMRLQASLFPDHPAWNDQAFVLLPLDARTPSGVEITTARLDHPSAIRLLDRAIAIKGLATLLRFAYLADAPVQCVWWIPSPACSGISAPRIQASLVDGSFLELRPAADPGSAGEGHLLMVQSGDPDRWFDTERWSVLASILQPESPGHFGSGRRGLRHSLMTLLCPFTAPGIRGARSRRPPVPRGSDLPTALPERKPRVARAENSPPLR
jgi:hypothetical protein